MPWHPAGIRRNPASRWHRSPCSNPASSNCRRNTVPPPPWTACAHLGDDYVYLVFYGILAVIKVLQLNAVPFGPQLSRVFLCYEILPELFSAAFAETAAGADGGHRQLALIQLYAGNAGVDLKLNDLFEIPRHTGLLRHIW